MFGGGGRSRTYDAADMSRVLLTIKLLKSLMQPSLGANVGDKLPLQ